MKKRDKYIQITVGIILGFVVIFLFVLIQQQGENGEILEVSSTSVPDFTFTNYEGEMVHLSDYEGTPMLLHSWASWCIFCENELPDFVELQEEFGDQIKIVAINRAESFNTSREFIENLHLQGKLVYLLDPTDTFYSSVGGFTMPETLFVDGDRVIKFHKRGPMTLDEMRLKTNEFLITK